MGPGGNFTKIGENAGKGFNINIPWNNIFEKKKKVSSETNKDDINKEG